MEENTINLFEDEFLSLTNERERNYLLISEAMKLSFLDENEEKKIEMCHLPTLYFLDFVDKKGYFEAGDFERLSSFYLENWQEFRSYELKHQLCALFSTIFYERLQVEEGKNTFIEWVLRCLVNVKMAYENEEDTEEIKNKDLFDRIEIMVLFELLQIADIQGISFQEFFKTLVDYSNANKDMPGNEDYVHFETLMDYLAIYVEGFITSMKKVFN